MRIEGGELAASNLFDQGSVNNFDILTPILPSEDCDRDALALLHEMIEGIMMPSTYDATGVKL